MPAAPQREHVDLDGVPETALWTLYLRATEARRPDRVLEDPKAVELVDRLDYPFEQHFGSGLAGQWQALRSRAFDAQVRRFLAAHPGGTVVALGEGLETTFWRVGDPKVRWLTVDLPESIALRRRLLPPGPRRRTLAASALETDLWTAEVDAAKGVLVTAQGLLMYFTRAQVHALVTTLAARFPGGGLVFDALPSWVGAATRVRPARTLGGYTAPPWTWGVDPCELRRLAALPGIARLQGVGVPGGRGLTGAALPIISRLPTAPLVNLSIHRAAFAEPPRT